MRLSWVELGDVAAVDRRTVIPANVQQDDLMVGLENITSDGGFVGVGPQAVESNKFAFTNDHILYGKLRPYLRKIAAPDFAGICSTDILPIRPGPRIDRRYLLHYLRSDRMVRRAEARSSGANLPRLSPGELLKFPIPLPQLGEQRRIAGILDEADALRAKRRRTLELLDDLTQSIFLDMFGDPVMLQPAETVPLSSLVQIVGGGTPSRAKPEYYTGSIPWATAKDISSKLLVDTQEHVTQEAVERSATKLVPPGSVLVVVKSKVLARRLPVTTAAMEVCFGQDLKALVPTEGVPSSFVAAALRASERVLLRQARGVNTEGLTLQHLRPLPLPRATSGQLAEFDRLASGAAAQLEHADASASTSDELFTSLQSRAFSGGL